MRKRNIFLLKDHLRIRFIAKLYFSAVQYVAQFPYTPVCNRYIFSSVKSKFLKFLSEIAHLLTINNYVQKSAAWSMYLQNYGIFPKTPNLPPTPDPVSVQRQNTIFPRKRSQQTDVSTSLGLLHAYRVFSSICEKKSV